MGGSTYQLELGGRVEVVWVLVRMANPGQAAVAGLDGSFVCCLGDLEDLVVVLFNVGSHCCHSVRRLNHAVAASEQAM